MSGDVIGEPTTILDVVAAAEHRSAQYGLLFEGALAIRMDGPGLHNRHHPHRVQVWDNTRRPNPRNGQPVRFGDFGPIDGGARCRV